MPELPEVEVARRLVEREVVGASVLVVETLDESMLEEDVRCFQDFFSGTSLQGTGRHGKHLFLDFGTGTLRIHLGMSGRVRFLSSWDDHTEHERLRLLMDRGVLVLDDPRRLGSFGLVSSMAEFVDRNMLGPDALTVSPYEFQNRLRGRRGRIKPLLLDQRVVAGVGNLYADEALFQARLSPMASIGGISQGSMMELGRQISGVLRASIEVGTDFARLPPGYLLRQRMKGGPCPRCGAALRAQRVGGRTAIFCPMCQGDA
ncbi:MAG: hypothetical protein JXA45_06330 [Methanomassiliicoccales archaeon]|nr:hypothetical protein [Methanomassiliicoccales archaeon]